MSNIAPFIPYYLLVNLVVFKDNCNCNFGLTPRSWFVVRCSELVLSTGRSSPLVNTFLSLVSDDMIICSVYVEMTVLAMH